MEASEALSIIQQLADGIDPQNGQPYPSNSPFQETEITRALHSAVRALESFVQIERRRLNLPRNIGKAWTADEETILANEFDSGKNVDELARNLQRTVGAVFPTEISSRIAEEAVWPFFYGQTECVRMSPK
jgi:hypothetical protein